MNSDTPATTDKGPPARYEAEIYPRVDDAAAMEQAYKDYMAGEDLDVVAANNGLEPRTLRLWAKRGGWVAERRAIDQVVIDEAARKLALKRAEKLLAMVESTVEVNEKIAERVAERLDEENSPGNLKALSEAHRNAADNSFRALGMGEDGTTSGEEKSKDKEGRKPLIVVFNGGGVPPVVRGDG